MPGKPGMYSPGITCHIIQRGNNREATFFSEQDCLFYLYCLENASTRYKVYIHACVLMTNHVPIPATPERKQSISLMMQSVGRPHVQYVNREYRRTGTLRESRYRASLVDAEEYL
jgi:putative transposase